MHGQIKHQNLYFRARKYVEYGRKRTHRGNVLRLLVSIYVKPTLTRINPTKLSQNLCARARTCVYVCVHTYVHSSDYAMLTFGQQCSDITRTAIAVRYISFCGSCYDETV